MRFLASLLPLRLHRSTYVVAALIAVVLLLANIPGTLVLRGTYDTEPRGMHIAHGWPWTFLARGFDDATYPDLFAHVIDERRAANCLSSLPQSVFWGLGRNVKYVSVCSILANIAA